MSFEAQASAKSLNGCLVIMQGHSSRHFMRPAARRALKLALRMHSWTLNPLLASRTSVPLQALPTCNSSVCTAAIKVFQQPVSGTNSQASAADLPVKRLHKARSSAPDSRDCKSCIAKWQLDDLACLADQHFDVAERCLSMLYNHNEGCNESRAGCIEQPHPMSRSNCCLMACRRRSDVLQPIHVPTERQTCLLTALPQKQLLPLKAHQSLRLRGGT